MSKLEVCSNFSFENSVQIISLVVKFLNDLISVYVVSI